MGEPLPKYTVTVRDNADVPQRIYGFMQIEDLLDWAWKIKESAPKLSKSKIEVNDVTA